jgi:hypothetical protein
MLKVKGLLVRVGVDQAFGQWNAPVNPGGLDFVYVPIPEAANRAFHEGLATPYAQVEPALAAFRGAHSEGTKLATLPNQLAGRMMHLDPDFARLTYGDVGLRRGKTLSEFGPGDVVVFYAGLRPIGPCEHRLLYAIIGFYEVAEIVFAGAVSRSQWRENAHTRRSDFPATDVIVRAVPGASGRLRRCIPIGEFRSRAYRVRPDLMAAWGGISAKDGFLQRSAVPPSLLEPGRFLDWFQKQEPELVAVNNLEDGV